MKRYLVKVVYTQPILVAVMADDEDTAREKAYLDAYHNRRELSSEDGTFDIIHLEVFDDFCLRKVKPRA